MSDVLYPLSLIERLDRQRVERTLVDPFEDGTETTRRTWPVQYFKRKFRLQHAPLTAAEFRYLRSFYSQRNGKWDSFWFRDNGGRSGNAKVRFATDLQDSFNGAAVSVQVDLEEAAPVRALVEWDELAAAAGAMPFFWHDPCKEIYFTHAGTVTAGEPSSRLYDPLLGNYVTAWQAGSTAANLGGTVAQSQYLAFDGTGWAKSSANIAELTTTQPAATLFLLARHSTAAASQILASAGAVAGALGIGLSSGNTYKLLKNGALAGTGQSNGTPNTWRSLCVTYTGASNNANFYANAAIVDTNESTARSYAAGPIVAGAASDGTLISNPANALANANVAQIVMFPAALTLAQIKAVHNLFAPLYGLAAVA